MPEPLTIEQSRIMKCVGNGVFYASGTHLDHTSRSHLAAHLLDMDYMTGRATDEEFYYLGGFYPDVYPRACPNPRARSVQLYHLKIERLRQSAK